MQKQLKSIPKFKNEDEEREFWKNHDSTEYIDWSQAQRVSFPNLKPSNETISLRLSTSLLNRLKSVAHKLDIPYQSLMKQWLADRLKEERVARL